MKNSKFKYIEEELGKFRFNKGTIGYECIRQGLFIAIYNPTLIYNLTGKLYIEIGRKMKLNEKRVKWNINSAINQMYLDTNMEVIMDYFSIDENEKLKPKVFFMTIIDKYVIA